MKGRTAGYLSYKDLVREALKNTKQENKTKELNRGMDPLVAPQRV